MYIILNISTNVIKYFILLKKFTLLPVGQNYLLNMSTLIFTSMFIRHSNLTCEDFQLPEFPQPICFKLLRLESTSLHSILISYIEVKWVDYTG